MGPLEVSAGQVGAGQVGAGQVGAGQVAPAKSDLAKFAATGRLS